MKGIKILLQILITLIITSLCWIPFYAIGPKTLLLGGLTMMVGFLLSTIAHNYVAKKLDKVVEDAKDSAYWTGMLAARDVLHDTNPRWARMGTPIYDDEGKEIGSETNYGAMDSAIRRKFEKRYETS